MKKIILICLITLVCCITVSAAPSYAVETCGSGLMAGANAHRGSASTFLYSTVYITNISESDVTCEVNWFDHNANNITSYCTVYTGNISGGGYTPIASGTGTFSLPAGATRVVEFFPQTPLHTIYGHATIKWTSSNSAVKQALIATGRVIAVSNSQGTQSSHVLPVNDNKPF